MTEQRLDFYGLNIALLSSAPAFLAEWLPGGRIESGYYVCANLDGGSGKSLKVHLRSGKWSDFSDSDKASGGDLTSLYAVLNGITQGEAARELAQKIGYPINGSTKQIAETNEIGPYPYGMEIPKMISGKLGPPSMYWVYRDVAGSPIFCFARYETPHGKQFSPWSYNTVTRKIVMRGYPAPRPLYGLELLASNPSAAIVLVEGEKACDAARTFMTDRYIIMTWNGGSNAWDKTDFSPIFGRRLILWPDADRPGITAMGNIAEKYYSNFSEVKVINSADRPDGWDAADAVNEGWGFAEFSAWAKSRISVYSPKEPERDLFPATSEVMRSESEVAVAEEQVENGPAKQVSTMSLWSKAGLVYQGNTGSPILNADNCLRLFNADPFLSRLVWFDTFYNKLMTPAGNGEIRPWQDSDEKLLLIYFQNKLEFRRVTEPPIIAALVSWATTNIKCEPLDWMSGIKWDGVKRVEGFMTCGLGAKDSLYTRAVSKNFWVSLAARIACPGCKVDTMVVLEGAQGTFKSTALQIIGGKWYAQSAARPGEKDFLQNLQGKLLMEVAELSSFNKVDKNTIKQVLSSAEDDFRAPYERHAKKYRRTCILAGTTNEDTYLDDPTGARRFWPVRVGKIDLEYIRQCRDQLFAEAYAMYKAGENWYEVPLDEATEQQELRQHFDEWQNRISHYLASKEHLGLSLHSIAKNALNVDPEKLDRKQQMRIAHVLKNISWIRYRKRIPGKNPCWYWKHISLEGTPDPIEPDDYLPMYSQCKAPFS